ncbi:MAG: hypothetical protein WD357_11270 [Gracilimonas sp.]
MILKNVFGKTIEAAKKSAQQMYGDDFLVIESSDDDGSGKASITIFSDKKNKEKTPSKAQPKAAQQMPALEEENEKSGVKFERSAPPETKSKPKKTEDKLSSLRNYAQQIDDQKINGASQKPADGAFQFNGSGNGSLNGHSEPKEHSNGTTAYGRATVRNPLNTNGHSDDASPQEDKNERKEPTPINNGNGSKFITHFKQTESSKEKQERPLVISPSRNNQREVKALHKRFDKLEALLDSALISANLDYASHPAFQQLVHTGINTSVIAGWFSKIIEKGIDPYDQSEQFMIKLGGIIRDALGEPNLNKPQKYMLFIGPSGSGKTSLIMKLSQHPELMESKKIAVVSVHPQKEINHPYYTILRPFCEDHDLPYFEVKTGQDVNDHLEIWDEFDHVLIDSPSINIEQENSFRNFWKIRQMLTPLTPLEVHYVVNASLNRFYFRNSSATHHPLQPDHVAITHLDEVSQWGPVIPFLQEMGCSARYISNGEGSPNSLGEFDPRWFAQRILEEN